MTTRHERGDDREDTGSSALHTSRRVVAAAVAVGVSVVPFQVGVESWLLLRIPLPDGWSVQVPFGFLLATAPVWLLFALVMPRVSYRRRDWMLVAFVPLYQWVVAARVGWRLAHLPERDWYLRPEERARPPVDVSRDPDGLQERQVRRVHRAGVDPAAGNATRRRAADPRER